MYGFDWFKPYWKWIISNFKENLAFVIHLVKIYPRQPQNQSFILCVTHYNNRLDFSYRLHVKKKIELGHRKADAYPLSVHICPITFKTRPFHILTVYQVYLEPSISVQCRNIHSPIFSKRVITPAKFDGMRRNANSMCVSWQ